MENEKLGSMLLNDTGKGTSTTKLKSSSNSNNKTDKRSLGTSVVKGKGNVRTLHDAERHSIHPANIASVPFYLNKKAESLKQEPNQPTKRYLQSKKKQIGDRVRYCSKQVFVHDNGE